MRRTDTPIMLPIKKIVQETPQVRTFTFDHALNSKPGQFVMLWIPGVDQKPFSVGADDGETFELSIFELGKATKALFTMREGDKVGVTGPYGTWYRFTPDTHLITVAGGYGAAPLANLTDKARSQKCNVTFLVGARDKENLLFEKRAIRAGADVRVATDDGSRGHQGYVTELLEEELRTVSDRKKQHTKVYACGPELMQKKVAEIAKEYGVDSEISIERYMKCGFGICGNCVIDDDGVPTCQKGPVMPGEKALRIPEFGVYHRDKTGIKHEF